MITAPSSSAVWNISVPWEVKWITTGVSGNVDIEWHAGDGYDWQINKVMENEPNDGSCMFSFDNCVNTWINKIVVRSIDDGRVYGESGVFYLEPCYEA